MFTGIVTAIGEVLKIAQTPRGLRLTIAAPYKGLTIGESIAVDGACLTVVTKKPGAFDVEAITSTRGRTHVDDYAAGSLVNLERAMRPTDRLGGHLVAGHVDGVGIVKRRKKVSGESVLLDLEVPKQVAELCVPQGSITVDGVSLTVNALPKRGWVQVALIPHTLEHTTLGGAPVGARVHLEADLVGKFVRQLVQPYRARGRRET